VTDTPFAALFDRRKDGKIGRHHCLEPRRLVVTRLHAAAIVIALFGLTQTASADPKGTWLTENGRSRVKIDDCGGALCGTIVWLKEPNDPETGKPKTDKNNTDAGKRSRPLVGLPIVLSMKPNGASKWSGQVYSPEEGKVFSGNLMEQGPNAVRLEGCAMGGLICKGQNWTRTQ
jgi:uncharacterized protein (DUF2147 family)